VKTAKNKTGDTLDTLNIGADLQMNFSSVALKAPTRACLASLLGQWSGENAGIERRVCMG
jgi:hypothetical protein